MKIHSEKRQFWVNMAEIWENGIVDAIEYNSDYIDFSDMPLDEFKEECIELISNYIENDMLGCEINFNIFVIDVARCYDMWND